MKKLHIICLIIFFLIVSFTLYLSAQVRQPFLAGKWYPGEKDNLQKLLKNQFDNVQLDEDEKGLVPFALISPHAGLKLSGGVAAYGYSLLSNGDYDTVILLGSSHNYNTNEISIYDGDYYKTPLGNVPIDKEITSKLIAGNKNFVFKEKIHYQENALETQIPYLQYTLKNFKIVPVLTATQNFALLNQLAESLTEIINSEEKKLLLVASTDMSHYHPIDEAKNIDQKTINMIEENNWGKLKQNIMKGRSELCGYFAVYTLSEILREFDRTNGICLKYLTSGDVMPASASRGVVGYSSFVFPQNSGAGETYTQEEKEYLLNLARKSIKHYLNNKEQPDVDPPENKKLQAERAVFVTLNKNGNLRGCIGQLEAQMPLYKAVSRMAVSAAFNDYRFPPLKKRELDKLSVEISILTPLQEVSDISKIEMGKDGVYVKKGYKTGVFLPQVAIDTGWGRKTFLENLCARKAGLPKDAYLEEDTEIYTFKVIKFED